MNPVSTATVHTSAAPSTQPGVVQTVIGSLSILAVLGFVGTFILVLKGMDGASIAVFSGLTGTALGGLMSALNNTRTTPPPTGNEQPAAPGQTVTASTEPPAVEIKGAP